MNAWLERLRGAWRRLDAVSPWVRMVALLVAFTAVLGEMIWQQQQRLAQGQEVVLKVRPFDPRDLLLGHYVRLQFDISRIPASSFIDTPAEAASAQALRGRDAYVVLRKDAAGPFWSVARASWNRPENVASGEVLLKGRVARVEGETLVHVRYGFERYYAPQKRAQELERLVRGRWRFDRERKRMVPVQGAMPPGIILRVGAEGGGAIIGWLINGRRVPDEQLF